MELYCFISSSGSKTNVSVDFKKSESCSDYINCIIRVLSYTIRSIMSFHNDIIYHFLIVIFPNFFSKHRESCACNIWKVFFKDISSTLSTFCFPTSNQSITPHTCFSKYISRYSKDISSMFEGKICSDKCSTFYSCFWYDDSVRECCYNLIANRKIEWLWLSSNRKY